MQTHYKTVLSEKQLASALLELDREAKLFLRQHGDGRAFRDHFTTQANELMETVSPRDCERASAVIEKLFGDLGMDVNGNRHRFSAAA